MQIKLNFKIFIFTLFFFMTNQLIIYLELMTFALLHEMGHMLMRGIFRFETSKIRNNASRFCLFI